MGVRHGPWCGAKTYPTRCRFCDQSAFYFSCDHGSKVFFEALGDPWVRHDCVGLNKHQSIRDQIRAIEAQIAELEVEYQREMVRLARERQWRPIEKAAPQVGTVVREVGVVRELEEKVDVYKRSGVVPGTMLAAAMLGRLAHGEFAQLTVHTGDLESSGTRSITFLVDRTLWMKVKAGRGDLVSFTVKGEATPNGFTFWLCTALAWID